ncbi:MAG: hypothetical protein KIT17_18250 [Rubrivivax sp.]|nr:hypothetical protein [Rubrivivax sp.]
MAAVRPHDDLVARVVAWHNRHPLARRITPAQVGSVGLVSFPFHAPAVDAPPPAAVQPLPEAPGRLRERARAQAGQAGQGGTEGSRDTAPSGTARADAPDGPAARARKGWGAAFAENLLDPHSPREVARWLLCHGSRARPGPADAPARDVDASAGHTPAGKAMVRLWVHTAAIELGAQRVRVLVSPLGARRVLGPRILAAGGRIAAWSGAAAAVAGAAVFLLGPSGWPAGGASRADAVAAAATPAAGSSVPAVAAATPSIEPGAVSAAGHASTHAAPRAGSAGTAPTSATAPAAASSASAAAPRPATAP